MVHAREKSRPRERRGRTEPGEPYICEESSLGDSGARLIEGEADVFGGRLKDRFDREGVAGSVGSALSSLLGGRLKSPVDGWVMDDGLEASDRERDLGERDEESELNEASGCSCWLNLLSNR